MKIEIDIRDKLYNDICNYCELLDITPIDYMSELIEKGFFMDKYGDLNQIFHKSTNEKDDDSDQTELYFEEKDVVVQSEKEVIEPKEKMEKREANETKEAIEEEKAIEKEVKKPTKRTLKTK